MRKTGTLVSWLVGGILACACSSSTSRKDATPIVGDSGASEVAVGDTAGPSDTAGGTVTGPEVGVQTAVLTIGSGMSFATPSLTVPAGTIISVQNQDNLPHTVTSEAAPDAFSPSGAFDTGVILGGGSGTITIPANAVSGTVYYYYCSIHRSSMAPPNGTITIQ